MNRLYMTMRGVATMALFLLAASCQNDNELAVMPEATRTIEVCTAATRTTIGYEGSDVSHLEWCSGDCVAYITDVAGDTFKSAEMKSGTSGWTFEATIPTAAKSIYVIYPVGENEGKTLAEIKATLVAEVAQVVGEDFDGSLLPMMATAAVPSSNRVDVVYECVASVVRFTVVAGEGHETETLKSVTLSANEHLVGDYKLDADGAMAFAGAGNSVTVKYSGVSDSGDDVFLANTHDLYVVIPSATYTGVDVVVETDVDSYMWSDGAMDLTHPSRRLYRVQLDLSTSDGAPVPKVPHFQPVLSLSEVTDDGTYLIAVKLDGKYYVTNNVPTDTANYYYVTGVEVASDDSGVIANDEVMKYTWTITKKEGGYEFYSANMLKQGEYGVLLISQGGTGMLPYEDGYEGKVWFVTLSKVDDYDATRRYWDIELDGEGKAVLRNKYDRGVDMFPCYKYCTEHEYFTLCFEGGNNKEDIQLLKLSE